MVAARLVVGLVLHELEPGQAHGVEGEVVGAARVAVRERVGAEVGEGEGEGPGAGDSRGIGLRGNIASRIAASYTNDAMITEACIMSSRWIRS